MKQLVVSLLFFLHLSAVHSLFAAKTYDFVVSYHDTYENTVPAKQAGIEENIKYMADAIYEMSNGAHKVGRVTVYTDGAFKDQADIIWQNDTGDDNKRCWFNAYIGGRLAEKGPYKRIEHCDIGGGDPELYNTLVKHNMGGYTLAHEQGHYFYGLFDEYAQGASPPQSPGSPSESDTAVSNSVMNSQYEAINGDMSWLNFSTSLNNQGNNAQFRVYQASAWDTLVRSPEQDPSPQRRPYYPELAAAAPAAGQAPPIELTGPEAQAAARSDLKIEWKRGSEASGIRENGSNVVPTVRQIVVDLSTHLPASQLGSIKSSLKQWIDNAKTGEYVSIIGFTDTVTVIQPLVRIDGTATKETMIAAINTMKASGSSSALGGALQFTLQQFSANNAREDLVWAVYLLSSGQNVAGIDPLSVIEAYQEEGVMVYAFNFGKEHDDDDNVLQQLAEETEGNYWSVRSANDFTKGLKYADEESSPVVDVAFKFDGDTVEGSKDFPFYVDAGMSEVAVTIFTVHDGQSETSLTVVDPQGNSRAVIASDCEPIDDEEWEEEGIATYCEVEMTPAPSGTWTLKTVATPSTELFYIAYGIPQDSNKVIFASLESLHGEELVSPKPMILIASVGKGFPITELAVTGSIDLPDGSSQDLVWHDDGVDPDLKAKDGLYTARFDYIEEGDYYATVEFNNHANTAQYTNYGVSYAANPKGNPEKQLTPVGENFERIADLQILVTAGSNSGGTLPILEDSRGRSVSIDPAGNFGKPGAKFSGGVTVGGNNFVAMAKATPQQAVTIKVNIEVAPEDVGKIADILFVKGIEPPPGPYDGGVKTSYFAYDSQSTLTPVDLYNSVDVWMAQLTEPFQAGVTLQSVTPIDLWTGPLNEPAMYYFFTGYRLEEGVIIYNTRPIMVHIE